jgi:integral membrane protein (TIGR01906 family)
MKRAPLPRLLQALVIVSVPVLLTTGSVRLVTSHTLVRWEYSRPGFPADPYGLPVPERIRLAGLCIDYLAGGGAVSLLAEAQLSNGQAAFDLRQLDHMVDVHGVYSGMTIAGCTAGLISAAALAALAARPASRLRAGRALLGGGLLTVGLLVALGLFMLLGWRSFFDSFHRTFFEEGTWTFYWSDTLIRLFPGRFWQDVAGAIVGFVALGALVVAWAGWQWTRRIRSASKAGGAVGRSRGCEERLSACAPPD